MPTASVRRRELQPRPPLAGTLVLRGISRDLPAGLETLLCDHNYVSAWEATRASLAAAMALVVLTLARNPIAWSGAYRAAVVNAAPNLKLLDAHIVADEELIEGANFSFTRFAAPVLCEAGERVNTRWGASPALGLDFAGLRRAAASLGPSRPRITAGPRCARKGWIPPHIVQWQPPRARRCCVQPAAA